MINSASTSQKSICIVYRTFICTIHTSFVTGLSKIYEKFFIGKYNANVIPGISMEECITIAHGKNICRWFVYSHVKRLWVQLDIIYLSGLVVAVMDHEHFRLKLLYKQKKEVTNDLKKAKAEAKALQVLILYIKCISLSERTSRWGKNIILTMSKWTKNAATVKVKHWNSKTSRTWG